MRIPAVRETCCVAKESRDYKKIMDGSCWRRLSQGEACKYPDNAATLFVPYLRVVSYVFENRQTRTEREREH